MAALRELLIVDVKKPQGIDNAFGGQVIELADCVAEVTRSAADNADAPSVINEAYH